jgi:cytochrome c peroxidase
VQGRAPSASAHTSSYLSVVEDDFPTVLARMRIAEAGIEKRQQELLAARYDLADRPVAGVAMSRGKAIQGDVRVKLSNGVTWDTLARMTPEEIRNKGIFPAGFMPLPHPNHPEGGMVFPKFLIDETRKQTGRDLTHFDLDFDLPDRFLPEFPSPIYLTTWVTCRAASS